VSLTSLTIGDQLRGVGGGESERGDGIKRLEDVALAGNERAAECGIEIMFLNDTPGEKVDGAERRRILHRDAG